MWNHSVVQKKYLIQFTGVNGIAPRFFNTGNALDLFLVESPDGPGHDIRDFYQLQ